MSRVVSFKIENLKKTYTQGSEKLEILKGIQIQIQKGEIVAVLGESGSGKSTFLSMLSGVDRADQGSIWIDQKDITKMSEEELTVFRGKNIGIVFQQFHLMPHLSALENVMLPLEIMGMSDPENHATLALEEVGLKHRLKHFPHELSGGECQRVAIARSIVTRPQLILADEPSGNLDSETGEYVMKTFFDTMKKHQLTCIVVTHSEALSLKCDRRFRLKNGLLQEVL